MWTPVNYTYGGYATGLGPGRAPISRVVEHYYEPSVLNGRGFLEQLSDYFGVD
jgi:hypothetical protein